LISDVQQVTRRQPPVSEVSVEMGDLHKVVRAIGRWLRNVGRDVMTTGGGPPATLSGERLRQQQQVEQMRGR
jgi:hypothetical protein